jgi:hypothetical protein
MRELLPLPIFFTATRAFHDIRSQHRGGYEFRQQNFGDVPMRKAVHAQLARFAIVATLVALLIVIAADHSAWAQTGPFGGLRPPAVGGIGGWLIAKQAVFYRALAGTIRAAKSDGSALWGLLGISFAYGIFHAAGPGHRKAVISS